MHRACQSTVYSEEVTLGTQVQGFIKLILKGLNIRIRNDLICFRTVQLQAAVNRRAK
jgi:hypothetical protein